MNCHFECAYHTTITIALGSPIDIDTSIHKNVLLRFEKLEVKTQKKKKRVGMCNVRMAITLLIVIYTLFNNEMLYRNNNNASFSLVFVN